MKSSTPRTLVTTQPKSVGRTTGFLVVCRGHVDDGEAACGPMPVLAPTGARALTLAKVHIDNRHHGIGHISERRAAPVKRRR